MELGKNTLKIVCLTAALVGLAACGKTTNENRSSTRSTVNAVSAQSVTTSLSTCSNGTNAVGYISDAAGDGTLTQEVQALVSATMNPTEFGEVQGGAAQTGIDFRLRVRRAGAAFSTDTQMQLMIYDQYAVAGRNPTTGQAVSAYPITMYTATGGTYAGMGSVGYIDFSDRYGTIRVHIQANNGTTASGYIEFQNTASTTGTNQSGILGSFVIPACVLM